MKSKRLRSVFSIIEILLGLSLIAIAAYSLWLNRNCSPTGHECAALGALTAIVFSISGFLVAATGCVSYYWRRLQIVVIQLPLAATLIAFYIWLMDY